MEVAIAMGNQELVDSVQQPVMKGGTWHGGGSSGSEGSGIWLCAQRSVRQKYRDQTHSTETHGLIAWFGSVEGVP